MIEDYRRACKLGRREVSEAVSQGRHPYPPSLGEVMGGSPGAGEVPVGVMEIPLELVVGTKTRGRQNMFSPGFMPIADDDSEFAAKWADLYDAQVSEGIREPVKVYEYLQRFYVQEGNKRVSVLRYLGVPTITARITRVMPANADEETLRRYHEFLQLFHVAPVYGLFFSREGAVGRLAELVGRELDEPWPEDAVRDLRMTYRQFASAFGAHGGSGLDLTAADAFLVYMEAYAALGPLCVTQHEMDQRVDAIWDEIVVQSRHDAIAFIEEPAEHKEGIVPSLVDFSRNLLFSPKLMRIAFIYDRNPQTSGWTALHEQGRLDMQHRLKGDVQTAAFYDCTSDQEFIHAVVCAANDGCHVVVTASPRQMQQARRGAIQRPEMTFINCSINLSSSLVRTFYARMYEVKFVMGALAASLSENHRVGYLAISPIYGSVAEINAFALGVQMVDPHATVYLKWVSAEGYDWQRELRESEVGVLAGRDYPNPQNPGEPYGLSLLDAQTGPQRMATPIWDWGRYYELIVRSLRDDTWHKVADEHHQQALNFWWGMSADVVRLDLEPSLAPLQATFVRALEREVRYGGLHPFDGQLIAQRGVLIHDADAPRLSNEEIASMRWLNANVNGRLPKQWELSRDGVEIVAASGVISAETDAEDNLRLAMRLLAISDVEDERLYESLPLNRDAFDLIVSCGDLNPAYLDYICTFFNGPVLYVPGNHDMGFGNAPVSGAIPLDGRIIEVGGLRFAGLGGSMLYRDGIVGYTEAQMSRRCAQLELRARLSGGIDVFVSHAPPYGHGDLPDLAHRGFRAFNWLLEHLQPRLMLHGHVHLDYGNIPRECTHPSGTRLVNAFRSRVIEL